MLPAGRSTWDQYCPDTTLLTCIRPASTRCYVSLQALLHVYQAALANPTLLPLRACRALGICLSDLALRSWPAQPAAQFDAESRGAAFTSVATPLVQLLQAAAAAPGSAGSGNGAAAVRQAAAVATSVVQSYAGSPKVLRSIVSTALVFPALPSVVTLLQASGSGGSSAAIRSSRAAAVLLRLITCCLESLPTELGSEGVEQLLSALVQAFATPGVPAPCKCPCAADEHCSCSRVSSPLPPTTAVPTPPPPSPTCLVGLVQAATLPLNPTYSWRACSPWF